MHASAGSCVSRSASAADGQRQGPRVAQEPQRIEAGAPHARIGVADEVEERAARRLQAQRARGRRGRPAHARISIREQLLHALARVGDAEGRGDLDGGRAHVRIGRAQRAEEPRRGPGQGRLAEVADRRGEHRAVVERIDHLDQLPRLRPLVAAGPDRQGREAIGRRVRAVGDDLRQQFGPLAGGVVAQRLDDRGHFLRPGPGAQAAPQGREPRRDLLPDHPPEHGQPDGVVGVVQCPIERPGDRLGPPPGHGVRRARGRAISPVDPRPRRLVDAGEQIGVLSPTARVRFTAQAGDQAVDDLGLGPVGERPQRQGARRPGVRPVEERQHGGPVRRSAHRLHGRVRQGGVGMAERPVQPGRRSRPAQPADRDRDFQDDARVASVGEGGQSRGQIGVALIARQAMPGEDRVGQVGHGADGLSLDARIGIGPGQLHEFIDRGRSPRVGQDPYGVQPPPHPDAAAPDRVAHRVEPLASAAFEAHLGVEPLGVARRVEQGDLLLDLVARRVAALVRRPRRPGGRDAIDAAAAPLRLLAVRPVGHDQRAVALGDEVGRLEPVRVAVAPGGELDLLGRREAAPRSLRAIAHHRPAPFAEEQVAAILGREPRFQVAEPARGRPAAEDRERRQGLVGALGVEVRIAVIRAVEAVIDADQVVAAVVLVVAHEDVQLLVQRDVVDVPQAGREDVQVAPVGATAQDAAPVEHQAIAFGPRDVTAVVAEGQVEPAVMPDDHAVGAVEPRGVLLGRQPQARQQVAPVFRHTVAVAVADGREERGVHHEQGPVAEGEPLDRVETGRVDRRLVGVPVPVDVLDEPDLVAADDLGPEARDVVDRDEDRPGPGPGGDRRGIFHHRVAGEQGGLEAGRDLQRREPLLGFGPGPGRIVAGPRGHEGPGRQEERQGGRTRGLGHHSRASRSRCGVRQPPGLRPGVRRPRGRGAARRGAASGGRSVMPPFYGHHASEATLGRERLPDRRRW